MPYTLTQPPAYWKMAGADFAFVELDGKSSLRVFQSLLDDTYQNIWTRDRKRHNPDDERVPVKYRAVKVFRSENVTSWKCYNTCRDGLLQDRDDAEASGDVKFREYTDVKSTQAWVSHGGSLADRLESRCNEWYLFHGTSAEAADKICRDQFNLKMAGGNTGTLYGRGIYFAESITKADEYSKPNADGECTVLLCRTLGGRANYVTEAEPDAEPLLSSVIEGPYDCIIGDRAKAKGTFREFIFYDTENFLPEYLIRYVREYGHPQTGSGLLSWMSHA